MGLMKHLTYASNSNWLNATWNNTIIANNGGIKMFKIEYLLDNYAKYYALHKIDSSYALELSKAKSEAIKYLKIDISALDKFMDIAILQNDDAFHEAGKLLEEQYALKQLYKERKAAIIFTRDTSGSMGSYERLIVESLTKWTKYFFKKAYGKISVHYIGFHTEAKSLAEDQFYNFSDCGGTTISTGLLEVNSKIYNYDNSWDKHVILISDGDNITSDCPKCINIIKDITQKGTFSYVEINQYSRHSTLGNYLNKEGIKYSVVKENKDVQKSFEQLIKPILAPATSSADAWDIN
jgi:hypothetical protein